MTEKNLSETENELIRSLLLVGRVIFDQKTQQSRDVRPYLMIYKIGTRFWDAWYSNLSYYNEALLFIVKECLPDIIVGLRAEIENLLEELGEPHEVLISSDSLTPEANTFEIAWRIMEKVNGATFICEKSVTDPQNVFRAVSIDGFVSFSTKHKDKDSEIQKTIVKEIGNRFIMRMLEEYDELAKRACKPARIEDTLDEFTDWNGKRLFEKKEDSPKPATKKSKRKA
jgi:hypothetical protein